MLRASRLALACVLVVAGLVLACGDDDDDNDGTPTRAPTASRLTSSPETPGLTPAAEGTPAVAPNDQVGFFEQFGGRDVDEEDCTYNPPTRVTDCAPNGLYAVDPPPASEDATCAIGIVDGNPEYIRCRSAQPLQVIYYDIQN